MTACLTFGNLKTSMLKSCEVTPAVALKKGWCNLNIFFCHKNIDIVKEIFTNS